MVSTHARIRHVVVLAAALLLASSGEPAIRADDGPVPAPAPPTVPPAPSPDPTRVPKGAAATDVFFANGEIPTFRLELAAPEVERLKKAPRALNARRRTWIPSI